MKSCQDDSDSVAFSKTCVLCILCILVYFLSTLYEILYIAKLIIKLNIHDKLCFIYYIDAKCALNETNSVLLPNIKLEIWSQFIKMTLFCWETNQLPTAKTQK